MTYTNASPITDESKGPFLTIASNLISSGDRYILQNYLILATNFVNYTLNMCGITKPSPVLPFGSESVPRILKLVNSPARTGCATVNVYTINAGSATCSKFAYSLKRDSQVMTENNEFLEVPGLKWMKNDSGFYSVCWNFNRNSPTTNLAVGTY
jgi:hypothetical protein